MNCSTQGRLSSTATAKSLQSYPTLCDATYGSPLGSTIPGILQARTLEWVAISLSNAGKWKVKVQSLSCVWLFATPWTAAYQAPPSMEFSRQDCFTFIKLYFYQTNIYASFKRWKYHRAYNIVPSPNPTSCSPLAILCNFFNCFFWHLLLYF